MSRVDAREPGGRHGAGARLPEGSGRDLADAVAAAVRAVDGVADLHAGTFGEVATYLPGRRVVGVRLRPETTEVHLVLRFGAPVLGTAEQVRTVVAALTGGHVDVVVQDVVDAVARGGDGTRAPRTGD